jgi:GTPase SAR1 family protein
MVNRLPVQNEFGFQWAITGAGTYRVCGRTTEQLPPGAYSALLDNCGNPYFQHRDLKVDELVDFPGSLPSKVLTEIERFWTRGEHFARYGFLHRRGYLLWGKQGCGKSSLIHQIVSGIVSQGHVAFFCQNPYAFSNCMHQFRQVEPDRPIVCIFEDIDAIIEYHGDSELLQWLDGNHQVDRAINIASTNYPEKLDRRITSRPRRFDRILRIDSPSAKMRETYFARKVPDLSAPELACWVEQTEGIPFAGLAELVISVRCLDNSLEETIKQLRTMEEQTPSSEEYKNNSEEMEDTAVE